MLVDAIVLAGAPNKAPLTEVSPEKWEALISIQGKPMVQWVVDALVAAPSVDKIILVGPVDELKTRITAGKSQFVAAGNSILENIRRGVTAATPGRRVLVVTGDIPLLTAEAIEDFISKCGDQTKHAYYSVVRRESIDRNNPNVTRTYVPVREGVFTGGNVLLLDSDLFDKFGAIIDEAIALRKKPLRLLRLLGLRCIIVFALRRLSIGDVERRVESMLGIRGAGVISEYAEVGIDVDKAEDYQRVCQILASS